MSGPPKVRSMNVSADSEVRPVLAPACNKARATTIPSARKPVPSPNNLVSKDEKTKSPAVLSAEIRSVVAVTTTTTTTGEEAVQKELDSPSLFATPKGLKGSSPRAVNVLKRQEMLSRGSFSLNASCSSEASTDSSCSRASTGRRGMRPRAGRQGIGSLVRKKEGVAKVGKVAPENDVVSLEDFQVSPGQLLKKRCAWVTTNTDPLYATFHDEEWGVPVHDDSKLFELLCLSGALAELTWPTILSKRHLFQEVFAGFDLNMVAKLNVKKVTAPGSGASSLLSELKLRAIIENAQLSLKIVEEFGSFNNYCWNFVNGKPIVSRFRYPRQVPAKSPKAEVICKDMIRRGFRSVTPTVVYSFMQAAGLTNDHLVSCYRFNECGIADQAPLVEVIKDEFKMHEIADLVVTSAVEELGMISLTMKTESDVGRTMIA